MIQRHQLERGFTTPDGGVDLLRMSRTLTPEQFREYINLCREDRAFIPRGEWKPGRFNA